MTRVLLKRVVRGLRRRSRLIDRLATKYRRRFPAPRSANEAGGSEGEGQGSIHDTRGVLEDATAIDGWVLVRGWSVDPSSVLRVGDNDVRLSADEPLQFWYRRDDVNTALSLNPDTRGGFLVLLPTAAAPLPTHRPIDLVRRGAILSRALVTSGPVDTIDQAALVLGADPTLDNIEERFERLGTPFADSRSQVDPAWHVQFSSPRPEKPPTLSIVIPLYGNEQYLSGQYACLATLDEPFRSAVEVVVANDKPSSDLRSLLHLYAELYGITTTLIGCATNQGFARAVNAGVKHAVGRNVIMLNSDCFFHDAQGVFDLAADLDLQPDLGTVAPLLLREDGAIDHLGMERVSLPGRPDCFVHTGAGLPLALAPREPLIRARYVTGACLAVRRDDFLHRFGGFPTFPLVGDFEDAALSDVIAGMGLALGVRTTVRATHFVRSSFEHRGDAGARDVLSRFNAWRYQRWLDRRESEGSGEMLAPDRGAR